MKSLYKVINLVDGTQPNEAVTKGYVDSKDIDLNNTVSYNSLVPISNNTDIPHKFYVDN